MTTLQAASVEEIAKEIAKFQRLQSQANERGERRLADDIGEGILAPLFREMARRQAINGGEPDYRKWAV